MHLQKRREGAAAPPSPTRGSPPEGGVRGSPGEGGRMLLRQLRRVVVSFNPLAAGALPAREFLARLAGKKARQSNPQCAVEPDLRDDAAPPHVYVEFGEWSAPRRAAGGRSGGQGEGRGG